MHKSGKPFRAMYRSEEDARSAPAGVSTVIGDFSNKESLQQVFAGVDAVFLVCSPIPELVELESNVIDVSPARGVKHIVLNSALGAGDYTKSFPSWHRKVEDKLKASGLTYTILRPNSFMQNILAYNAPSIRAQGAFYSSLGNARLSYLDVRDIAVVVAKALLSPGEHAGKTYELNGPEAVTCTELAERISCRVPNSEICGHTRSGSAEKHAGFENAGMAGDGAARSTAVLRKRSRRRSDGCVASIAGAGAGEA